MKIAPSDVAATMSARVQASAALTEALLDDPFHESITEGLKHDPEARQRGLMSYFQ